MSESESELVHRERNRGGGPIVAMGLLLIPILYILSPPFIVPLFGSKPTSNPVFTTIYYPLIYLSMEYDAVNDFYNWYGSLFPWLP